MTERPDAAWMAAALALAERGIGRTGPNPAVGCVIVRGGEIVGRGVTAPGGRPHAEALALDQAGPRAAASTLYVTLEPCAHESARGPACTDLILGRRPARVVVGCLDPDPRTHGQGVARLRAAGIPVEVGPGQGQAERLIAGFRRRLTDGRPEVTLKIASSLDGCIALADGTSRWITGPDARAHAHLERARHDAILVGSGTLTADDPALDVRLPGLEDRTPQPYVVSRTWTAIPARLSGRAARAARVLDGTDLPAALRELADAGVNRLLVEGGAGLARALVAADLVDRLLWYQAPILLGAGLPALGDIGLIDLADAHGRWTCLQRRTLGQDHLAVFARTR